MKRFALVGHPVAHSSSPALHNGWFDAVGVHARYLRIDVDPERLPTGRNLLDQLRSHGLSGANLTAPLKQLCLDAVDHLDPTAAAAGAINTLVWQDGWHAHNTDVEGFSRSAQEAGATTGTAVVLGAGGAARAVCLALRHTHSITVLNRTPERARALAEALNVAWAPWGSDPLCDADLVVVAVSGPGNPAVAALDLPELAPGALWMDLNYWNATPPLRQQLLARKIRFDNGYGMLLHQAALAFELFVGRKPPLALGRGLLFPGSACDKSIAGG